VDTPLLVNVAPSVSRRVAVLALALASGIPLTLAGTNSAGAAAPAGVRAAPRLYRETETPHHPVRTFRNHHRVTGVGKSIAAGQTVLVSCKVYDPSIPSVKPDGYWYRIASRPWRNRYYAPANTFLNGDPSGGPYTRNTDRRVRNC
jgi:hypothetical protein